MRLFYQRLQLPTSLIRLYKNNRFLRNTPQSKMESLLVIFPELFRYITSFIVAWGLFASLSLIRLISHAANKRRVIRKDDVYHLAGISFVTGGTASFLFVCPNFASQFMFSIFMMEVWYVSFIVFYTYTYLYPCLRNCFQKLT